MDAYFYQSFFLRPFYDGMIQRTFKQFRQYSNNIDSHIFAIDGTKLMVKK
jgi:hypothetical protein